MITGGLQGNTKLAAAPPKRIPRAPMTNKNGLRVTPFLSLLTGLALVACASTGSEDEGSGGSAEAPPPVWVDWALPAVRATEGPTPARPARAPADHWRGRLGPRVVRGPLGRAPVGRPARPGRAPVGRPAWPARAAVGRPAWPARAPADSSTGTGGSTTPGTPSAENTGANCNATSGALKKNKKLPNPFAMHDGTIITTKAQWECRRNEVQADLEKYEIGPKQAPEPDRRRHPAPAASVEREGDDQLGLASRSPRTYLAAAAASPSA